MIHGEQESLALSQRTQFLGLVDASGQLMVFSNATRREGTWSKAAPLDSTVWLDDGGNPMVIPPGPVWVEIVPLESPVSWSA